MNNNINKTLIIGLGLIGGSLAKALKLNRQFGQIVGYDRDPEETQKGLQIGVIDIAADSLAEAVEQADLIVLAVPVKAMEKVLEVRAMMSSGHATLIRADDETRQRFGSFHPQAPALARLSEGLRRKFDPEQKFNPGMMG